MDDTWTESFYYSLDRARMGFKCYVADIHNEMFEYYLDDLRPVALTPAIMKVFERFVLKLLLNEVK